MNQSKLHWSQNYTKSHNLSLRKVFLTSQKWRKDRKITNLMRFLKMKNMNLQILKVPNTEKNKFLQKWMIYDGQKQPPVAYEKAVLQNFANFTGKHRLSALHFYLKRLQYKWFPAKFAKFLRKTILKNICERLLLEVVLAVIFKKNNRSLFVRLAVSRYYISLQINVAPRNFSLAVKT